MACVEWNVPCERGEMCEGEEESSGEEEPAMMRSCGESMRSSASACCTTWDTDPTIELPAFQASHHYKALVSPLWQSKRETRHTCFPVNPWQITRVSLLIHTLALADMHRIKLRVLVPAR